MVMMLGLIFVWSIQPYNMIISLMVICLSYSIFIYYSMGSYWFSYMLILVMMSGVLVLFTYIASLIPNEGFEYMGLIYLSMFIYLYMLVNISYKLFYNRDCSMYMLKMWKMMVSLYNFYLVLFLLMIMVMVVWLSSSDSGAVRNFLLSAWLKG